MFSSLSLVPTLSFDPAGKEKGLLSLAVSFLLQAAEREAEDIPGHMGPRGGALMTRVGSKSLLWSWVSTVATTRYSYKVMQMQNTNRNTHIQLTHRFSQVHAESRDTVHHRAVPIHPSSPASQAKQKLIAWIRTKINLGMNKQSKKTWAGMRWGEINNGKYLLWTNKHRPQSFSACLPSAAELHLCLSLMTR